MKFNRALNEVKVISFDLDDTLYDNHPIIKNAIEAQQAYLANIPKWQAQPGDYWRTCREQYAKHHPEIVDDVTKWRQQALLYGLQALQVEHAQQHATAAFNAFATARSQIVVSDEVIALLAELRKQFKVIAITNGNVDISQFNLRDSFDLVLQAGPNGRAKPHSEMFEVAAKTLSVPLKNILHVGDSLDTDVQGANHAGCMSAYLALPNTQYGYKGLADLEIKDVMSLKAFLTSTS